MSGRRAAPPGAPPLASSHPCLVAFICGLVVEVIGFASEASSSGTGYGAAKAIITGQADWNPI